ncbi:CoF synthetase [Mariniflexile sp.]|uniref:CoF synthetase n=1 Tax=Mariniflexile sp. TaxID=1979402 RepID=UPI003568D68A
MSNIRLRAFNIIERFISKQKRLDVLDVKTIIENSLRNDIIAKKNNYLIQLLKHASNTTGYYKNLSRGTNITDFPVTNKNTIKSNFHLFESSKFKGNKLKLVRTSGSTGLPFKTFQNKEKVRRNNADNLYFSKLAGYSVGNKLYYFRMWDAYDKKSFLNKWLRNIKTLDVFDLNDAFFNKFVALLSTKKHQKSFIGYASTFEQLCKYLDKTKSKPIQTNLQSVIAISESLNTYTKEAMKKYFQVDMVSRYSNVENGIIAQQLPGTEYFLVNTASYFVEILDLNTDTPIKNGNPGRIVITDLFNYAVPMIRYDTGDIGIMDVIEDKIVLTQVLGRNIDTITDTKGDIILNNIMMLVNNYHELNQCQLIQKSAKTYLFKINIKSEFKREKQFIADFRPHLGSDAIIEIEYVSEIPLMASGKRRVMVNEMS